MMRQTLQSELAKTSLSSGARLPAKELAALVEIFIEALGDQNPDDVREAISEHRQSSGFMPRPNEIFEAARMKAHFRRQRIAKLPPPMELTDEQIKTNLKNIRAIKEKLAKKKSMEATQ